MGWELAPGGEARFREPGEFDVTVEINREGFRGSLPPPPKEGGPARILALGDEETLGTSVAGKETFLQVLVRGLARRGLPALGLNGGVEGYATDQEYLWFLYKGSLLRPDLVLLAFRADDVYWVTRRDYQGIPKPLVEVLPGDRGARLVLRFSGRPSDWERPLWRRSRLLELLAGPLVPLVPAPRGRRLPGPLGGFLARPPKEILQGWKRVEALLAGLKQAVEKRGGLVLAFPIPHRSQVRGEATHAILDRWGLTLEEWNVDAPSARFLRAARAADLEAVDSLGYFRQAAAQGKVLFYRRSGRLTPEGHRLLARILEWKLRELGWRGLGK